MKALLRYDAACQALAEAKDFDEVKDWANKAEAMRVYARQAGNVQMEQDATEIRLRAVRRFGQLELELKTAGLMHKGGRPKTGSAEEPVSEASTHAEPVAAPITLADLGVTKKFSSQAQAVGGIADQAFEAMVVRKREEIAQQRARVVHEVVKEQRDGERREAHQERTYAGGKVEHLHQLAAQGFRAGAILADPAWHFLTRSEKGEGRSAAQHYTTDRTWRDIIELPVKQLAADDCVLFMWMVDWCPKLALDVIEAWGFEHKTTAFTWAKQNASGEGWHMGQGYWTRANPEDCWLATRGNPKRVHFDVRQLIIAPVMEHSRKPDEVHDRIMRLVGGPYLELYARRERDGWLTWGDELEFKPPVDGAGNPLHHDDGGVVIEFPAPEEQALEIPKFLRRGHPECTYGREP